MLMKDVLTESSKFTKVRKYLADALRESDYQKGITIATPMNPMGGEESQKEYDELSDYEKQEWHKQNNKLMDMGEQHIKQMNKNYYKQKGVFEGQTEKSFIIFDTTREEAIDLGKKWQQSAVVYISIEPTNLENENMIVAEMIDTATEMPISNFVVSTVSKIFSADDSITDNFSQVGSRKWVIPFFDTEEEALAHYKKEYGSQAKKDNLPRKKAGKHKGDILIMNKNGQLYKLKNAS